MSPAEDDGPLTRLSLLRRVRDGSIEGWASFFEQYSPVVLRWCTARRLPPDVADDLCQNLMLKISDKLETYDPVGDHGERQGFRRWLRAVVSKQIADHYRDRRRRPAGYGAGGDSNAERIDDLPDGAADSMADELAAVIWARLELVESSVRKRIHPDTWAVYEARVVHRKSIDEVALEFKKSYVAVCVAINRVRKFLSEEAKKLPPILPDQ